MSNEKFKVKFGLAVGDTAATIDGTTGDIVTNGDIQLGGNDIKASDGNVAETLVPITGYNPNVDFPGNIVKGAIRTGAGESVGSIFNQNGTYSVGISADNIDKLTDRTSVVLRNYGGSLASGNPRTTFITENARGTPGSPTNLVSGNFINEILGTGYTSAGWLNDLVNSVPAIIRTTATENWSNGINNVGTGFQVLNQPTATTLTAGGTSLITTINHNPQSATYRSDAFTFSQGKTSTNNILTMDSSGTLNFNNATTNSNYLNVRNDSGKITASVNQTRSTGPNDFAVVNFTTYKSTDGVNYTPTQNGETLGSFKFNGNANTSTSPGVAAGPGASIVAKASETWTSTANGTLWNFNAIKNGTTSEIEVISISPSGLTTRSAEAVLADDASLPFVYITRAQARFDVPIQITGSTSGSSKFSAPATGSTLSYVLPGTAGAASTVLTNDGSGNLSWALPGGGGSTFGNITVGVDTDNTISTTTGDLVIDSVTNTVVIGEADVRHTLTINGEVTPVATTGITSTATVFTITHGGGTLGYAGGYIYLSGVTPAGYNGLWFIATTSAGNITVASTANLGTASVQGSIYYGRTIITSPTDVVLGNLYGSADAVTIGGATAAGQPFALNNAGNVFTNNNFIKGVVRDTVTLTNGDAWSFLSGAAATDMRGISVDNTNNTAKRPGMALRGYSNSRPFIIGENNRGTVASPLATASGNNLLEIAASGYNGTQWVTDAITAAPISISLQSAEAFTSPAGVNTANGARLRVDAQPTGVTATAVTRSAIINHIPTAATYRADAWTFATREAAAGGTNTTQLTLDSSGNAVVTGDLAVNGGDLTTTQTTATLFNTNATTLNVGQAATTVSLGATTGTSTVRNALNVRSGLSYSMLSTTSVAGGSGENNIVISKTDSSSSAALAIINFVTQRSTAGTYTPTLSGDVLGQFKFNGNVSSTTTPSFGGGPAGGVFVAATENWTASAIGSRIALQATKNGATAPIDVISISPNTGAIKTDALTIEDSAGTDYMVLNNSKILNNRPYRNVITTATTTEGSTYSPAATDNNSISLTINTGSGTTVIDLANLTGQGDGGMYSIMVFNNAATGTPIQVKNTRINTNNLMTHTIGTGNRIIVNAYVVGDYATATHLQVA